MDNERGIIGAFNGRITNPNELIELYGETVYLAVNPILGKTINLDKPEQIFLTKFKVGYLAHQTATNYTIKKSGVDLATFDTHTNLFLLSMDSFIDKSGIEYYYGLPLNYYNVLVPGQLPMKSLSGIFRDQASVEKYLAYMKLKHDLSNMLDMMANKNCIVAICITKKEIKEK